MTSASQPVEGSMDLQPIDYDPIYLETIEVRRSSECTTLTRREWLFVLAIVLLVPLATWAPASSFTTYIQYDHNMSKTATWAHKQYP